MAKRKIIPILVVLILIFIASQFNAFGNLAKLTGKLIEAVKATITKVNKILVVKEKDAEKTIEVKREKQTTVSIPQKGSIITPIPENLTNSIRDKKPENDDWEDEMLFYPFSDDINDNFYQEPEYDNVEVEESNDWDNLLESLTIEIFSLSNEDYLEYFDANDEEGIDSLFSPDELSSLEQWLNIDKKSLEESENSIWELPELMDDFNYLPNEN